MEIDPDFDHPLTGVAERDIDLLLLEEFQTNELFVKWFCGEIGMKDIVPDGSWRSVANSFGETDLLLRVRKDDSKIGLLIENKIDAAEQDLQSERYAIRGTDLATKGILDSFKTIICAPEIYLNGIGAGSVYNHRVAYEKIALWFGGQPGQRNSWRQYVMTQAIAQAKRGYKMIVDPLRTKFQQAYWQNLQQNHPFLKMSEPKQRGGMSYWIILKGVDFPKGVQLSHKFNFRTMELGFIGRKIEDIQKIKTDWQSDGIRISQNGGTASLVIDVPYIDMQSPFEPQLPEVEKAMQAAESLLVYARLFETKHA